MEEGGERRSGEGRGQGEVCATPMCRWLRIHAWQTIAMSFAAGGKRAKRATDGSHVTPTHMPEAGGIRGQVQAGVGSHHGLECDVEPHASGFSFWGAGNPAAAARQATPVGHRQEQGLGRGDGEGRGQGSGFTLPQGPGGFRTPAPSQRPSADQGGRAWQGFQRQQPQQQQPQQPQQPGQQQGRSAAAAAAGMGAWGAGHGDPAATPGAAVAATPAPAVAATPKALLSALLGPGSSTKVSSAQVALGIFLGVGARQSVRDRMGQTKRPGRKGRRNCRRKKGHIWIILPM